MCNRSAAHVSRACRQLAERDPFADCQSLPDGLRVQGVVYDGPSHPMDRGRYGCDPFWKRAVRLLQILGASTSLNPASRARLVLFWKASSDT